MNRDFKGVWIPASVWTDKSMSITEKAFLVEIDSLDNEQGCFASNKYFSEFFGLSKQRCSQIILSLVSKGYITSEVKKEENVTFMRTLRVSRKLDRGYQENLRGYQENLLYNNTVNNTSNTISFDSFYSAYPKKVDKANCKKKWMKLKDKDKEDALEGIDGFVAGKENKYISSPTVYLNGRRWEDEAQGSSDVNQFAGGI